MASSRICRNGRKEHGVPLEEAWRTHREQKFTSLHNEGPADVSIKIGSEEVLVHRLAIETYSKIIKACETSYNSKSGKLDVYLPREFDGHKDLVFDIIQSFYSGDIPINDSNIKMVHRFAKMYSVTWLLDHVLTLFIINEQTFSDIFKFAHIVWCNKLKDLCLQHLNSSLADKLVESGELFQMDYYCIQRLTVLDNDQLPKIKLFDLICRWYENDTDNRKWYMEKLLFDFKYPDMSKSDLVDFVQDWLINTTGIEEKLKFQLITTISKHIKDMAPATSANQPIEPQLTHQAQLTIQASKINVDRELKIIVNFRHKNPKKRKYKGVTATGFITVVRQEFKGSDPLTRKHIFEYLSANLYMIDANNITDFIQLVEYERTMNIMSMNFIERCPDLLENIDYVHYVLQEVISVMDWKDPEHQLRCFGAIINWALSHPEEANKITTLFNTHVCFCVMPVEYKTMVLLPYLKKIFNTDEYDMSCNAKCSHCLERQECIVAELTEKFYLLENHESTICDVKLDGSGLYHYAVKLNVNRSLHPRLQLMKKCFVTKRAEDGPSCEGISFVLFDREKCFDKFPAYSYCRLDLSELRELIVEYRHLHVMIFPDIS